MENYSNSYSQEPARATFVDRNDPISGNTEDAARYLFRPDKWSTLGSEQSDKALLFGASFMVPTQSADFAFLRLLNAASGGIGII
ncbi:hypothetical protein [Sedimenticola selenatireducens]|uniref:Uncharacterized protein n=1 Tax=Sedimenticola selenatireducens TaxID=191960 RepID=A0A557SCI5_9GAMM|nr:hypothetical protein [Sedimenticola selenatireducens]TVO75116.1 hypothetical protein FHP88_08875 [Sedimenticola selenatireducens]TVT67029.1 MAG: hypothetical protein FHK78_01480 [Sedimenticola selenatireducens]